MRSKFILHAPLIFIILVLITILTRFHFMYSDPSEMVVEPEKLFGSPIGLDFFIGAMSPALQILQNTPFYTEVQTYGPSFSIILIPILQFLSYLGGCPSTDLFACGMLSFRLLILISGSVCLLLILITTYKDTTGKTIFFLFLSAFLLSMSGSLAIHRGNLDIIYAMMLGILVLPHMYPGKSNTLQILWAIITGIISGGMSNSKVFFIPFTLFLTVSSKKPLLAVLSAIVTYIIFSYTPLFYRIPPSPLDPITSALKTESYVPLANPSYLGFNHTFAATASLLTSCVEKKSCDFFKEDALIIKTGRFILFIFVFLVPFVLSWKSLFTFMQKSKSSSFLRSLQSFIQSPAGISLFLTLSYAVINLIPSAAFLYRLTYALPIFLLLYKFSVHNEQSRSYLYLSMIFLILKGQWIGYVIHPKGFTIDDPRFLNVFVVLHAFFLIRSALSLMSKKTEALSLG